LVTTRHVEFAVRPSLGVTTREEVRLETLFERMLSEAIATDSVVVGHLQVGAWCRV